ncbi:DUF4382 domain-containing protein [Massilia sp. PAMC28688]|uniref:DUF4382 domain-containing protein n=1 Tax=Massilia sp. PAMC28688 TaxID=2861283 RepID=UPI001C63A1A5|nr:DUF4382 domain-containing protein [Massilia sp. PAMC28688]QYF94467.1 DUF4382 domain-containing protein [Massilia sp. PAMC28688]
MTTTFKRFSLATTSLIAAATLVACGGGGGDSGTGGTPGATTGRVAAFLTDAPACGFDAVNVTVSKVRVHKSATAAETDGSWTDITPASPRKINLLTLTNGAVDLLGETELATGTYNQVRLVLDPNTGNGLTNSVVPTGGTEKPLDTPSAVQSGLKLVGNFEVVAGAKTDIVIDFDACKSVLTKGNGNYALKPVVKLIPAILNGISGYISTAQLAAKPMVSAQQNGVIVSATVPSATGEFRLARLPAGTYDVVITADNAAASVIGAVPVAATTTTAVSTTAAPITLAASPTGSISGTVVLSPVSTTTGAYVAAKQTLASGPTVTVKYAGADVNIGAYSITGLPLTNPNYAVYSSTLPLTFASNAAAPGAATYNVEASAAGYTAQTLPTPVVIATANAINVNFTLTP